MQYKLERHSIEQIPPPAVPLNSIKPDPMPNKIHLKIAESDLYLDLYQIVTT